jgi:hypothetical protein
MNHAIIPQHEKGCILLFFRAESLTKKDEASKYSLQFEHQIQKNDSRKRVATMIRWSACRLPR